MLGIIRATLLVATGVGALCCSVCATFAQPAEKLRLRLEWTPQAQFAGYIVAQELGWYQAAGLNLQILPAGPDLKPQVTVASGTDDIGVGVANEIVTARDHGVPLKIIAQIFQDSANRYVLKKQNSISSLLELRGKPVGLWLGGDEAEFVAMLKTVGMTLRDVRVIPQGFSVIPFLQDQYVLSEVTIYNELILIERQGYGPDKLQILSPSSYKAAILGDMLFTTEKTIATRENSLVRFLTASLKGWQFALNNPNETVTLVTKYNRELKPADQRAQLKAISELIKAGEAPEQGIGYMDPAKYQTTIQVLLDSGQISKAMDPHAVYDAKIWAQVSMKDRKP